MRCKRFPKIKRFFAGTEYEATVDVGECAGGCRKGTMFVGFGAGVFNLYFLV